MCSPNVCLTLKDRDQLLGQLNPGRCHLPPWKRVRCEIPRVARHLRKLPLTAWACPTLYRARFLPPSPWQQAVYRHPELSQQGRIEPRPYAHERRPIPLREPSGVLRGFLIVQVQRALITTVLSSGWVARPPALINLFPGGVVYVDQPLPFALYLAVLPLRTGRGSGTRQRFVCRFTSISI